MAKKYIMGGNGSFRASSSADGTTSSNRVFKGITVDGVDADLYSIDGDFIRANSASDLYYLKQTYGDFVTPEEYPTKLSETIEQDSLILLYKLDKTFMVLEPDEFLQSSNFEAEEFSGTYYYNLHTSAVVRLETLPEGYIVGGSVDNQEKLNSILDPDKTITCSICGANTVSEDTCECRSHAQSLWDSNHSDIRDWNYVPNFQFRTTAEGQGTFGIELEMNAPDHRSHPNMTSHFKDYDFLYLMHDGSLPSGTGVEMASHPFSFEWFQKERDNGVDMLRLDYLRKLKMETKECSSAGLHIHIAKTNFLNDKHFDTWYRLMTCNLLFLEKISGRTCGSYNNVCNYPASTDKKLDDNTERSAAISNRGKTIEFRMMKSDIDRVYFGIEMLHATIEWAKTTPKFIGWTKFKKFLRTRKETYPNLVGTFIDKKVPKGLYPVGEDNQDWLTSYDEAVADTNVTMTRAESGAIAEEVTRVSVPRPVRAELLDGDFV